MRNAEFGIRNGSLVSPFIPHSPRGRSCLGGPPLWRWGTRIRRPFVFPTAKAMGHPTRRCNPDATLASDGRTARASNPSARHVHKATGTQLYNRHRPAESTVRPQPTRNAEFGMRSPECKPRSALHSALRIPHSECAPRRSSESARAAPSPPAGRPGADRLRLRSSASGECRNSSGCRCGRRCRTH